MRLTLRWNVELLLPASVFAFSACTVKYTSIVFNTSTRWLILAALFLFVFVRGKPAHFNDGQANRVLLAYLVWCSATILWSEVVFLSGLKVAALCMVVFAIVSSGQMWVRRVGLHKSLDYLFPMLALVLFAGIVGTVSTSQSQYTGAGTWVYRGFAGNSNMLGSLANMAMPLLLWRAYRSKSGTLRKLLWIGTLVVVLVILLYSVSRSSILAAWCTATGLLVGVGARKRFYAIYLLLTAIIVAYTMFPAVSEPVIERYVFKGEQRSFEGALFSRSGPWETSLEAARAGGLFGLGYGVSFGETRFEAGVTSFGYGREKGNTQLAIVEETGLVGLSIYLLFVASLFAELLRGYRRTPSRDYKVLTGILIGCLVGLLVQSVFEAWWVAPGAPETVYFWAMVGVALGIIRRLDGASATSRGRSWASLRVRPAVAFADRPSTLPK